MGVGFPAPVVELDDLAQRGDRSVMHVGSALRDFPHGGRLESAELALDTRDLTSAFVGELFRFQIPADTEIVEECVGEVVSEMTLVAARFVEEELGGGARGRRPAQGVAP